MEPPSTHIQSLKYSSYSYLTTRMMLLISTLHNLTCTYNMEHTISMKYLLEGCLFALLAALSFLLTWLSSFVVNAKTTAKTVNFNECFESHESFIGIFLNL